MSSVLVMFVFTVGISISYFRGYSDGYDECFKIWFSEQRTKLREALDLTK